mgnify:CR=1 FL=1
MIKKLVFFCVLLFGIAASETANAKTWEAVGSGKVIYPSGRAESLSFGFAYQKSFGSYVFKAGDAQMRTDQMPPNYILNIIINKEGLMYVAEFADGFFESFELNLGDHYLAIKPRKALDESEPYKHLVVLVDDMSYLIDTTHPSLKFIFSEEGIKDIDGVGLIRDLSSRR